MLFFEAFQIKLEYLFFFLSFSIIFLLGVNSSNKVLLQTTSIVVSAIVLILSCKILQDFDICSHNLFQNYFSFTISNIFFNINFSFGLDGLSILFFVLTSFLIFLCIIFVQDEEYLKEYIVLLFILQLMLLILFTTLDLFMFYIFFEAILIPMFLIIGIWGSRERKIRAGYLLFFYTLFTSLPFLLAILYIYSITGSSEYLNLIGCTWYQFEQYLWLAFFFSFASKIPMFPFHIWLPEAHVEAPTVGSVILAGILLKLGVYGFLRYSLVLFPNSSMFFTPFVYTLSLIGIIYASFSAIRQTDLKRIIAYSSIAHMNLIVLGLFSFGQIGLEGAILQSLSHGFVSGALFFLVGILYNRYHTRLLFYYSGLVHMMPLYATFFLIFTMANIALPGTSSFIGEFTILLGVFKLHPLTAVLGAISVVLSGCYSLWLYNRIIFGNLNLNFTSKYKDLTITEFFLLFSLVIWVLFIGVYPAYFLDILAFDVEKFFLFYE